MNRGGDRTGTASPRRGTAGHGQRGVQRGRGNRRGFSPKCQICGGFGHTAVACFKRYADAPTP